MAAAKNDAHVLRNGSGIFPDPRRRLARDPRAKGVDCGSRRRLGDTVSEAGFNDLSVRRFDMTLGLHGVASSPCT